MKRAFVRKVAHEAHEQEVLAELKAKKKRGERVDEPDDGTQESDSEEKEVPVSGADDHFRVDTARSVKPLSDKKKAKKIERINMKITEGILPTFGVSLYGSPTTPDGQSEVSHRNYRKQEDSSTIKLLK
jgi:hypothetical protein